MNFAVVREVSGMRATLDGTSQVHFILGVNDRMQALLRLNDFLRSHGWNIKKIGEAYLQGDGTVVFHVRTDMPAEKLEVLR